jgi:protein-S-isoprenylcysteine O-methyltransferase Ste14
MRLRRSKVRAAITAAAGVVIVSIVGVLVNLATSKPGWLVVGGVVVAVGAAAAIEAWRVLGDRPTPFEAGSVAFSGSRQLGVDRPRHCL